MDYLVYYVARDRKTGRLVEDSFVQGGKFAGLWKVNPVNAQAWALDLLQWYELELLHWDGPFALFMWPELPHFRKPKWMHEPPSGITPAEWKDRLRSLNEWRAYREGMDAAGSP